MAEDVAKDIDGETIKYIKLVARESINRGEPTYFIMGAFSWADSEKGYEYWTEMTHKFCDSHPMVSAEELPEEDEEDSIECNKCGNTNVSVSCFGDRTGVNCRDCGESRLLVD